MVDFKRLYLQSKVWFFRSIVWCLETLVSPGMMLCFCTALAVGSAAYAGQLIAGHNYAQGAFWVLLACINGGSALMSKDRIAIAKRLVVLEQEAAQLENIAAQSELHYTLLAVLQPKHKDSRPLAERIGSA